MANASRFILVGLACLTLTACGGGGGSGDGGNSGPPPASVTVSGRVTFERVPFAVVVGNGLDYGRTFEAPAREVEVELLRSSNQAVLATTVTDLNGNYTVTAAPNTSVIVRAKALSRHTGAAGRPASWDIRVRDNTSSNALYVLDSSAFSTGITNQTRNLKATTGWSGSSYTGVRAAAPFAVLDTIYSAVQFVATQGDSGVQLPALSAYWSEKNVPTEGDVTKGQIDTTAYYPASSGGIAPGIYVLGAAVGDAYDTDEFDQHIIAHEFQHYLEDTISRSDTVGRDHALNERLDMRLAFSEGYANAFSAMVLDDPLYRDSFRTRTDGLTDFHFSVETTSTSVPGWYNEASVHRIVWDLYDTASDGVDAVSIGYAPMHNVFMNELRNDVPLTSLFAFITALKQRSGVPGSQVDALVEAEGVAGTNLGIVSSTMNAYATTETHSGVASSSSDLVLPVYAPIALGGSARLCTSSSITSTTGAVVEGSYNKLGNRRFLRFSVPTARPVRITLTCAATDPDCTGAIVPDPDFVVWRGRNVTYAETTTPRFEQLDYAAAAGDYVLEIYEWSHIDLDATERRGRTCMTVNITG